MRKKSKNCEGFTLVELIFGVGILAFVLTAFLIGILKRSLILFQIKIFPEKDGKIFFNMP